MVQQHPSDPRLCFLVLSSDYEPWKSLYLSGPAHTWIRGWNSKSYVPFFTYSGKTYKCDLLAQISNFLLQRKSMMRIWTSKRQLQEAYFSDYGKIHIEVFERWDTMTIKFLSASKLLLDTFDFDYLVRTNTTTYVNQRALSEALASKADYLGVPSKNGNFAVGWGQIFSRNAITKLVESFPQVGVDKKLFEDEFVGEVIKEMGYEFKAVKASRISLSDTDHQYEDNLDSVFIRMHAVLGKKRLDSDLFAKYHKFVQTRNLYNDLE